MKMINGKAQPLTEAPHAALGEQSAVEGSPHPEQERWPQGPPAGHLPGPGLVSWPQRSHAEDTENSVRLVAISEALETPPKW